MAEAALASVSIIISVLEKLRLPENVEEDIRSMRSWLTSIRAFIEDNDGRQRHSTNTMLKRLTQVQKIAYDVEDVIDDFILHSPPYTFHRHTFTKKIHTYAHHLHHNFPLHAVKHKIASINKQIKDIKGQVAAFGNGDLNSTSRVSPLLLENQMVGHDMPKIIRRLVYGPGGSNRSLLRSYMDLSSSLKCCLMYMSIFPEDYSVERGRLIRLWVAECFAVATDDHSAEEVAESYLNELIHKNLIHVSTRDFDGRPRNCHLLNIVLNFIIQKCKDEKFASVFPRENANQTQTKQNQNEKQMIRRLSVHDHGKHWPGNDDLVSVRSLFLLRWSEISPSDFEKNLHKLKLIKVVDVQGIGLTEFPKDITRFTLLRYLSFRHTKIKLIPKSIKKLSYLETLDLKRTHVTDLPQEISHLQNLCHLLVYKYDDSVQGAFNLVQGAKLQCGINKLTNLQSLSLVKVGRNDGILNELKALIQLRKLGLTGLKQEHGKDLCEAVELMKSLRTLDLCSATQEDYIELEGMKNPPECLERLYLKGRLKKFPSWIRKLDGLVRIGLKWSKLIDSPLEGLKGLQNLTELQLVDCYEGKELIFERSGFQKLKFLEIEELSNVKKMVIEKGAMCEVKKICLGRCTEMRMVLGMGNLNKVELSLRDMAEELEQRR